MKEGLPATTSEECMGEGKVLMRIVPCELDLKRWAQFSREESESSEGWRDGRERPWKAGKRRECEGRTSHSVWLKYGTNRWWGRKHKKSMLGSNKPVPKMLSFGGYNSENRGYKGEPDRCPSLPSGSGHSSGGWGSQGGRLESTDRSRGRCGLCGWHRGSFCIICQYLQECFNHRVQVRRQAQGGW